MLNINFGWLNDYSGSKFAPFTLADKVLLNTENNTTESFYDYVKHQNSIINDKFLKKDEEIAELQNNIKGIIAPAEQLGNVARLPAQEAYYLVSSANNKLNEGDPSQPVYFYLGKPKICYNTQKNSADALNDKKFDNIYINYDSEKKELINYINTYITYNYSESLNANISGIAAKAKMAEASNTSVYSNVSDYSSIAMQAHTLSHKITFKDGDITGEINKLEPSDYFNDNVDIPLTLKSVLQITTDNGQSWNPTETNHNFGGVNGAYVNIPAFTVDQKGRIIKAQNVGWTPTIPVSLIENANTTQFPLLTAIVDNKTGAATGYYASNTKTTGVYIERLSDGNQTQILMGAAWNDYAEFRNQEEYIEPGYCVASYDNGKVYKTTKKLQACDGIVSDTFGFSIGKTEKCQTPLAVSGRVLAYYEGDINDYHSGDTVCAGPDGKVCKMTREEIKEYPDRIVGIVSEIPTYEKWNNVYTKNRIWIKIR